MPVIISMSSTLSFVFRSPARKLSRLCRSLLKLRLSNSDYLSSPRIISSSFGLDSRQSSLKMPPKRKAAKDSPEVKECDDTPVESGVIEIDKANVPSHITDEESLKMKEKAPYRRGAKRVAHKADDAPSNPASKDLSEDKENDGTPIESDVVEMDKANVEDIKTDEEPLKKKEKMPARRGAKRGAHKPDDAPQSLALKDESEEKEGDTPLEMDKANVESLKTDEESSEKKEKIPARRGAKRGAHKADDALCNPALKGASAHKESNVAPVGSNIIENDDNVEGLHAIEESSIKKEKLRSRRVAKRGAHKADDAPPNPASEDVSEGKEGVTSVKSDVPEVDKANVESLKTDEESLKKKEHAPSRKGAKRGAHKPDDAPSNPASKDAAEGKEIETPVESNVLEMDKTNVDIIKTVEESLKMKEKVPSRRGAKRGAHKPDEAPSNPDDNVEKTGETNQSNSGENPTVESEAPNKKRGGKKNNKEDNKESPGEIEDKDSPVDMEPKSETETLPKKREGRKNVQEPEKEAEPSKTKKGGRKNVQGVKEAPKPVHEMGSDDASNGSDEPAKEEKGAGKRKGAKDKEDKGSKKTGSEPDEKKSKLDEANEVVSYECEKLNKKGEKWNLKISTWNVAGMRAWVKKNGADYVKEEDADIICFQETKCPEGKVPAEAKVEGYHMFWASGKKDGYAGVALYSKEKPLNVSYGINNKEHDEEGRIITAEFEKFYLVTTYVPNSGQGLKTLPKRMDWDTIFRNYLKDLDAKKPVILCGDLNVAHEEIDLANPKTNTKSAGFTKEERENMTALLKEGFVDSYRQLYPGKTGSYTFWTYMGNARSRNTGWRLDYFVVSERLMDSVCDVAIRNKVLGSDHCPLTLFIHV